MNIFSCLFRKKSEKPAPADPPKPAAQETEAPRREVSAAAMDFSRVLTSQLVAFWLKTERTEYRDEYLRRMGICGLDDETAEKMLQYETEILTANPRPELLDAEFISKPLFSLRTPVLDHPVEYYETHFEYPFSYIVKLSDEAEWHFWNSHERNLSDEVWEEIFALSDKNRKLFLPFAKDLLKRGWDYPNVNKFSYHEQGMLDRYRWGKSVTRAATDPWK